MPKRKPGGEMLGRGDSDERALTAAPKGHREELNGSNATSPSDAKHITSPIKFYAWVAAFLALVMGKAMFFSGLSPGQSLTLSLVCAGMLSGVIICVTYFTHKAPENLSVEMSKAKQELEQARHTLEQITRQAIHAEKEARRQLRAQERLNKPMRSTRTATAKPESPALPPGPTDPD